MQFSYPFLPSMGQKGKTFIAISILQQHILENGQLFALRTSKIYVCSWLRIEAETIRH